MIDGEKRQRESCGDTACAIYKKDQRERSMKITRPCAAASDMEMPANFCGLGTNILCLSYHRALKLGGPVKMVDETKSAKMPRVWISKLSYE